MREPFEDKEVWFERRYRPVRWDRRFDSSCWEFLKRRFYGWLNSLLFHRPLIL